MPEITLPQLEEQYATNARRQELLTCLKEELVGWQGFLAECRVWLFGSYLSDKPDPDDIDVLVAGRITSMPPLPRKHKAAIHVKCLLSTAGLATKESLVNAFNEENAKSGIQLSADQVTDLVL